jgi:hypothetical protein
MAVDCFINLFLLLGIVMYDDLDCRTDMAAAAMAWVGLFAGVRPGLGSGPKITLPKDTRRGVLKIVACEPPPSWVEDFSRSFVRLEIGLKEVSQSQGRLEESQSEINRKFGFLLESEVRREAERMFGGDYSRQFTATSIVNLVQLLPEDFVPISNTNDTKRMTRGDRHMVYLAAARKVAEILLDSGTPELLLKAVHAAALENPTYQGMIFIIVL